MWAICMTFTLGNINGTGVVTNHYGCFIDALNKGLTNWPILSTSTNSSALNGKLVIGSTRYASPADTMLNVYGGNMLLDTPVNTTADFQISQKVSTCFTCAT